MAKKNEEQHLPATEAPLVNGFDLGTLPELPDVIPIGHLDTQNLVIKDRAGRPIQGAGIPDGTSGFYFQVIPGDMEQGKIAQHVRNLQAKGWRQFEGMTCHGLPDTSVIMGMRYQTYLQMQAAKRQRLTAVAPDGGSIKNFSTSGQLVPVRDELP